MRSRAPRAPRALHVQQYGVMCPYETPDGAHIGLIKALDRQVVAEGVESAEHGRLLLQMGCERGQGYGIARPMAAAELPIWMQHWRAHPEWLGTAARPLAAATV